MLLRYTENFTAAAGAWVQHGAIANNVAPDSKLCSATREDFGEAAAAVLSSDYKGDVNVALELAGDEPYTMTDLARIASEVSGKPIKHHLVQEAEFSGMLQSFGFPKVASDTLADAHTGISNGALAENGNKTLSKLIGRKTTPLIDTVKAALAGK